MHAALKRIIVSALGPEVAAPGLMPLEELLDLALTDSFPASDPPALVLPHGSAHEAARRRPSAHDCGVEP